MTVRISPGAAGRSALAAQGFDRPHPVLVDHGHLRRTIDRVSLRLCRADYTLTELANLR